MRTNPCLTCLFFLCTFFAVGHSLFAQSTGTINGKVTVGEKPLQNASVGLLNTTIGAQTDEQGQFEISNVPAGNYELRVSAVGIEPIVRSINVVAGASVTLNLSTVSNDLLLKEITITSTGIKDEIKNIPGTVNVLDGNQIRESGAQSVGQIINRIPGVNYLDEDGRGLKPNIGLRGLDPLRNRNLLVLVDGKFPIGMTLYGDPAAYYMIPLEQVERIEVIKGASPVLYGGYSVGGVVNMISKRGEVTPQTNVGLSFGSWNAMTAQISTGADNGKFNYHVSGLRRQGDGYRDRSEYGVNDYAIRLGGKLNENGEISLYLNYFSENSETPGGITQAQYNADPTQSQHSSDHFYAKRFSTALSYKHNLSEVQTISTSIYGNYFQRDWYIAYSNPTNNGFLRDIHAIGNVTDYNLTKDIAGHSNSLIVGFRFHTDRLDDINMAGATKDARTGSTTGNKINTSLISEFYVYDEFDITGALTIAPGIRYTNVKYKRNDLLYRPTGSSSATGRQDELVSDAFVYSAGLIYKIEEHSRVYATFSKGFQPPALNSSLAPGTVDANVDLQPETSQNLEIGTRINPVAWLSLNVSAYRMDFDNKVITESGVNKNAGSSFHRGIEAELELGQWNGFSLFANITRQKATFANGEFDGNILPNAPQKLSASGLRYRVPLKTNKLVLNLSHNYVGKQYSDAANTEAGNEAGTVGSIPSYHVTNFTVNYNIKKFGVFANVNNVFDKKYYTFRWATWYGIIPSPDRNFMTGVTYKF
jgi:Fe(3+) dicitrate transport protein